MVGRRVLLRVEKGPAKPGAPVLEVEHLTVKDGRGVTMVDDVSFDVRAGEIVGIAGVAGNGQSELLEAIAGIRDAASGRSAHHRQAGRRDRPSRPRAHAPDLGLAHVPEDRHHMGLVLAFEENENSILGYHGATKLRQRAVPRHRRRSAPTRARRSSNTTSARRTAG